jgi:hypothetical protein
MKPLIKPKGKNIDEMSEYEKFISWNTCYLILNSSTKRNYLTELTLKSIAHLAKANRLSAREESDLVSLVLAQSPLFFAVASAYHDQAQEKFMRLLLRYA